MEQKKQALLELGEADKLLFSYQNELENLPAKLKKAKTVLSKVSRKKEKLESQDRIVLNKIEERQKLISIEKRRSAEEEKQMADISNQTEYIASKKRKETAEKVAAELDKQIFHLEDSRKEWTAELDQVLKDYTKVENSCLKKEKKLGEGTSAIQTKLDELHTNRKAILSALDKDLASNYEKITDSKLFPTVVSLNGTSCMGCAMNLPPQVYQEILKKGGVGQCPHCRRLVVLPDEEPDEKE